MAKIKTSFEDIWKEYQRGITYNSSIGLYETVEKNERFFIGDQWHGVNAPDLDKPVMNVLQRPVSYFIANLVSDDIGVNVDEFTEGGEYENMLQMLGTQFDAAMETMKFKPKARDFLRNCAVDGDCFAHYWFDTDETQGSTMPDGMVLTPGVIREDLIDNINIHFGNPEENEVQAQPYILINFRRMVDDVRETAEENGLADPDIIVADGKEEQDDREEQLQDDKVTVVRKYWKQKREDGRKTVFCTEVTRNAVVRKEWDTGMKRYPVAYMAWEKVKNRFHGQAAITGMLPNQIFINKLFAMSMQNVKMTAFPKIIFNKNMIPDGWDNSVGTAIGVNGDPNMSIAKDYRAQDMSNQVLVMIEKVIQYTRDTIGASDAALGNVRPDNTSAIIATQKASSLPLELQKISFYDFVEESVRIWMDMFAVYYGTRPVRMNVDIPAVIDQMTGTEIEPETKQMQTVAFDFSQLREMDLKLNVDIGPATYWSELMQAQTLDNLVAAQIIPDAITYLENMPRGYIPGRQKLIEALRKKEDEQKDAANAQMMMQSGVQSGNSAVVPEAAMLEGLVT